MSEPLPLNSPRWRELEQAYGSAEDVPRLLEHLDAVGDEHRHEIWLGLWHLLWRDDAVLGAAHAAVPHLVRHASRQPARGRAVALHLVGAVEAARRAAGATVHGDDLRGAYEAAIAEVPRLIAGCVGEPWDDDTTQVLASVLAITKGHASFGAAALALEPLATCPVCGAAHPTTGWLPVQGA